MNRRYHWDEERGLVAIHRSPVAADYPSPDQVRAWMSGGVAPAHDEEPDRCPTCGRTEDCACSNCEYCGNGAPPPPRFRRRTDPTGTENGRAE